MFYSVPCFLRVHAKQKVGQKMKRDMVKRKSKNQTAGKSQREVDKEYRGNAMEMGGQAREGE